MFRQSRSLSLRFRVDIQLETVRSTRVEIGKTRNCVETRGPIAAAENFTC